MSAIQERRPFIGSADWMSLPTEAACPPGATYVRYASQVSQHKTNQMLPGRQERQSFLDRHSKSVFPDSSPWPA